MTESMTQLNLQQLSALGLKPVHQVHYQLSPEVLTEQTVFRGQGVLNDTGALCIHCEGCYYGRHSSLEQF
jgi:phosphoenolpyruvate carboxykinase (ATP)